MPNFRLERDLHRQGYRLVAGLDEAGRGAWAGPLYAAAVILPLSEDRAGDILRLHHARVRDGKRINSKRRERLYEEVIKQTALAWDFGWASVGEIDERGLTAATRLAMERALNKLQVEPEYLLIDGHYFKLPNASLPEDRQNALKHGEWEARCIAAASIVAKVERDRHMIQLDARCPGYGFAQHKGYGTRAHRDALKDKGPCEEHRRSFKPIAALLNGEES